MRDLTQATSAALRKHFSIGADGAGKDVCSVISTGHYLIPVLSYGIIGSGGVLSIASVASTISELSKQIQGARSKILVSAEATRETAVKAAEEAGWGANGGGRVMIMSEGKEWSLNVIQGDGQLGHNLIDESDKLSWQKVTDLVELTDRLVILIYSSGTTGLPKGSFDLPTLLKVLWKYITYKLSGVKLSHRNLVSQAVIPNDMIKAWAAESRPEFRYRTLAHLPMAHIAGIQCYLFNPTYMGGTVYWMPRFDFEQFLHYNAKYRITLFFTVPPIYLLIAKSTAVKSQFKTLELAISGAAPLGKNLQHAASRKLGPNCFISQTWGLTETTGSATFMPPNMNDDTGSVSPLLPGALARIIDDGGKDVEPGMPGEILVKGPGVCRGYFENDAADREAFTDEDWFHTGDIGEFRNGLFYIVDRKKELIKCMFLKWQESHLRSTLISVTTI